jgi:hypothetical protein
VIRVDDQNKYKVAGVNLDYQGYSDKGAHGERRRSKNAWKEAPELMAELQRYDPALKVVWDDWKERWCVWRESQGADFFVYTVEGPNGEYRDLDAWFMRTLLSFDSARHTSPHAMATAMEQEEEAEEERAMQEWRDEFDYATKHDIGKLAKAVESLAGGLPPGEPEKPKEKRKPTERYLFDDTGRKLCRISCSTAD